MTPAQTGKVSQRHARLRARDTETVYVHRLPLDVLDPTNCPGVRFRLCRVENPDGTFDVIEKNREEIQLPGRSPTIDQ